MENKTHHFSLSTLKPVLTSLQSSIQALMQSAGGTQAVLEDALGLIEKSMSSDNVPLALVEEVVTLLEQAIKAKAAS